MSKNIPIKNIYYLLIYAWDRYQEGKSINLEVEKSPDLPDLLSDLLFKLMCRVIKKGLDKDYKGKPFGIMPSLLCESEIVTKLNPSFNIFFAYFILCSR